MGLAGQKNRTKLSHDPNNTAWAKNTDGFGHKILAAQGWKPGDYLGAENANHADHYTAANASHIRVMLREDNLGLGAQIGRGSAETFGLSMFSGLLGRLNGKSDVELEAQQKARRDAEIRVQHEQRYGHMNFVSGGFLVGDKMEVKVGVKPMGTTQIESTKRKRSDDAGCGTSGQSGEKRSKRSTGRESTQQKSTTTDPSSHTDSDSGEDEGGVLSEDANTKAEKRRRKELSKPVQESESTDNKALEKAERRARKAERRKRKEEKRERKALKERKKAERSAPQVSEPPVATVASAVISNGSRHATRQRYIQQKRMASMDPQALKEIFMLQAAS